MSCVHVSTDSILEEGRGQRTWVDQGDCRLGAVDLFLRNAACSNSPESKFRSHNLTRQRLFGGRETERDHGKPAVV